MAEATSSKLVIRSTSGVSMHSAAASHGVDGPGCARPRPSHVQRDTNVRRDARVWAQPKWILLALVAQLEELPPCKRQVARSNRRRGHHQTCRVRLDGRGHRAFNPGTLGSNPARDASTRSPRRAHASRVEIGRNDWAAPEPVTGWISFGGVAQHSAEQPPCKRQAAGSNPVTSTKFVASLTQRPECRPV